MIFKQIVSFAKENNLMLFAEDQGIEVKLLRNAMEELQIPGIRVMLYTLHPDTAAHNLYDPYPANTIVYTSTHDTETLFSLIDSMNLLQRKDAAKIFGIEYKESPKELLLALRRAIINSPPKIVIIPIQDWLLTTERINTPGTEKEDNDPNWQYRLHIPIEQLPRDIF